MRKFHLEPPFKCSQGELLIVSLVQINAVREARSVIYVGGKSPVAIVLRNSNKDRILAVDEQQIDIPTLHKLIEQNIDK